MPVPALAPSPTTAPVIYLNSNEVGSTASSGGILGYCPAFRLSLRRRCLWREEASMGVARRWCDIGRAENVQAGVVLEWTVVQDVRSGESLVPEEPRSLCRGIPVGWRREIAWRPRRKRS